MANDAIAIPVIELRDVHLAFGESEILRGIDLQVELGTTLVIMGESGSVKSVPLKSIIGLLKPQQGQVLVDGVDLVPLDEQALLPIRERLGMVFESSAHFDGLDVFENVAFPLRQRFPHMKSGEVTARVEAKLALFDLREAGHLQPEALSGGMRERVALARAVLDPAIWLHDEPTTGLDPINSELVAQMILRAKRELRVTSVAICQDLSSAFEIADWMAFLHEGKIVASGTPAKIRVSAEPEVHRLLALWQELRLAAGRA